MKKLITGVLTLSSGLVLADMKFDPVTERFFTFPCSDSINQYEYHNLMHGCGKIIDRTTTLNYRGYVSASYAPDQVLDNLFKKNDKQKTKVLGLINDYLKKVGTLTAHKLMEDFKKNSLDYKIS